MNEYDFQPQEVDQNSCILPLPQSLRNSRVFTNNGQSFVDQLYINDKICEAYLQPIKEVEIRKQLSKQIQNQPNFANVGGNSKFTNFLQKQKAYQKKTQEKIIRLKQNIESKVVPETFQPEINKKSKYYARKTNENVFDRLCKNHTKKQQDRSALFHPHISDKSKNIQRNEPIQEILYKDAKIRKERYESLRENGKEELRHHINTRSEELVGRKFFKEYSHLVQQLQVPLGSAELITKQLFLSILGSMGFISSSASQQNLIDDAYDQFCKSEPTCTNLFTFLLVLMGVYHVDPFNLLALRNNQHKPIYITNQNYARNLHKKYNILYNNRLYLEEKSNESLQNSFSFKPAISPQSQVLAEKHRKNLLAEASKLMIKRGENQSQLCESRENKVKVQSITHPQFLILNQKMKQLELQIKRQAQIKRIMEQCTFQPKVSKFEITKRQRSVFNESEGDESKERPSVGNSPMLILDVDFNGKQEQIVLRSEDKMSLARIANYYSNKYLMDAQSEERLLQLLSNELQGLAQ